MKKQLIWVFEWSKSVHYWWSNILFASECRVNLHARPEMCSERDSPLELFVLPAPGQPELARLICGAHLSPPVQTRKQKRPRVNSLVCDGAAAFCAAGPPEVLSRMSRLVTTAAERERELARARCQQLKQAARSQPGESVSRGFAGRGALEGYPYHYTSLAKPSIIQVGSPTCYQVCALDHTKRGGVLPTWITPLEPYHRNEFSNSELIWQDGCQYRQVDEAPVIFLFYWIYSWCLSSSLPIWATKHSVHDMIPTILASIFGGGRQSPVIFTPRVISTQPHATNSDRSGYQLISHDLTACVTDRHCQVDRREQWFTVNNNLNNCGMLSNIVIWFHRQHRLKRSYFFFINSF